MIDKLVIASKLTGKSCAEKNGKFVYWMGNDENSTELLSNDILTAIDLEYARLQVEYQATQYQRDRAAEYPPITDYIDGVVKNDQAQIDKYIADCLAVKAKYPKGVA
jgi:hypothetical protein